ncbi:hypothetical protein BABINDRAFT_163397 [Babjeviella inositovora NRRL Y-12698]|uniref:THIF-type NAD/FAD binding fold domain-containing protein n=1 Tax=Babjeviella inositovora NRRL Y-12698 TaxID=984486 RepID=A0A1E3QL13_9ASCO|nr:uncharacterized protein BABINDRAFT_163397 [Babjeviella inositovora NRRL Y-12698]ODQ77687.1 hypothetical protein BABINDRAFT_163397 [Babjeviella inositovora NRRL Y-12698]
MGCHKKLYLLTLAAVVVTAGCVEAVHAYLRSQKKKPTPTKTKQTVHDEELIREQLARNYTFLSEKGMEKVRNQRVVVVGAGGVGSWVTTMLVRAGVLALRIIDFDQVSLSSLNRHSVATLADVGVSKVEILKAHSLQVAPWCEIDAVNSLWTLPDAEKLIYGGDFNPTYVVDCIDNIDTKVDLLAFCYRNKIPVVSSGGAGCKSDPTRINIGDISSTEEDPLCRSVRRRLKKMGINGGIPVVFSAEKPDPRKAALLPLEEAEFENGPVEELSALKNFRVRILPVLGTMPGMFGLTIATHILTTIAGYPIEPIEGKNRIKVYDGILQSLAGQQTRVGENDQRVPISIHDVQYLVEEVWRGKSPISNYSTRLTLCRWDPKKEPSYQNIVLMTKEEQKMHEQRVLNGGEPVEAVYDTKVLANVRRRFAEEEYYSQYR